MTREATEQDFIRYREKLDADEKSPATMEKYVHDAKAFLEFAGDQPITKSLVLSYKERLVNRYAAASVNCMLASVNSFLSFMELSDCRVKQLKIQRKAYCDAGRELSKTEYLKLVETAHNKGCERLEMILLAICGTGIRISELPFVTVEAVECGQAEVRLKGKTRTVFLPGRLRTRLAAYAKKCGIRAGSIFVTRTGKPIDRSNVWKQMKELCEEAGVSANKVFPHNLRHLFARSFYAIDRDIAKLADVMGHSSIETTRIYLVTSGKQHARTVDRLGLML